MRLADAGGTRKQVKDGLTPRFGIAQAQRDEGIVHGVGGAPGDFGLEVQGHGAVGGGRPGALAQEVERGVGGALVGYRRAVLAQFGEQPPLHVVAFLDVARAFHVDGGLTAGLVGRGFDGVENVLPRPPCLEQGLGPVHAEQEAEIHVDGQPGGAEHVPELPCVDVSEVAAAGHIGDEPAHPFPARGAVDGHVHEHVHTHGAHVRRGLVGPGGAHAFDARAVLGGEGGDLFGLREALRDDDAVARLFGDERFEAEQVGGRGHDVLIARIGAHFGLQRPLEQAHFRGKELLVGVEEFRIGKAFHLGREGGDHGVVHRAAYFSQRAQPVEVGLHGLGRVEEGLRVQLAVRRGQRTEGKGGVFTRTGFGVDHFGGGSEPGEGNFVAFDGVKADGRIGSKLHAVKAELADGRRNSRGLRLLRAVDSMKLRHDEAPSFLKRVYDVFLCSKKRTRALPVPEACPGGARVRGGGAPVPLPSAVRRRVPAMGEGRPPPLMPNGWFPCAGQGGPLREKGRRGRLC